MASEVLKIEQAALHTDDGLLLMSCMNRTSCYRIAISIEMKTFAIFINVIPQISLDEYIFYSPFFSYI